jgi:hypothetical protein
VETDRLIDYSKAVRPTRNRLLIAMGVSTCFVVLLLASLGLLFNYAAVVSRPSFENEHSLTVHISNGEGEENSNITTGNKAVNSLPPEQVVSTGFAESRQEIVPLDSPDLPADSQPVIDWRAIADDDAKASVDEYFRQEDSRASMWRQTRSIMFQPANDIVVKDEEPLMSDIRFKRRSRVVGLGINVGSCFIGIPIAGIPVEERSIGITVFVCGQDS